MLENVLLMKERIEIATKLGESHYREFKSAFEGTPGNKKPRNVASVCDDVARTLVAFANADGGELLIGVEDSGDITGVNYSQEKIDKILHAPVDCVHKKTPLPSYKSFVIDCDGKNIIYFSISKGNEYVYLTSDGRCIQRKDIESIPISSEEIRFSREEKLSREYDREFLPSAEITDLDIELLTSITNQLSIKISPEKFLQHLDLAEFDGNKLKLKRAALLLFAKKPNKWHPRSQLRVLRVGDKVLKSGEEYNVLSDEEVTDNIINLIESSWDLIRPHLTETKFLKQALFKTQILYPELACREALINSIAHRDYSIEGRGIEVYVYTDRLEIVSPGELLSTIKIDDIEAQKGVHQSRNSNIARALREIGYMRELGEGINRIYHLMKSNDLEPPKFLSKNKSFSVILSQKLVYSKEEKLWLDNFESLNLSREQKTVVRLGTNGNIFSPNDVWEAVGIVDTDKYRQLLESLREYGILKRTLDRDKAYLTAKRLHQSKKEVKQFEIVLPGSIVKDNLEKTPSSRSPIVSKVDTSEYTKVYVSNIPYDSTEDELFRVFSSFGVVSSVQLPKVAGTEYHKGFAFIEFDKKGDAIKAISQSSKVSLRGYKMYVQEYRIKK